MPFNSTDFAHVACVHSLQAEAVACKRGVRAPRCGDQACGSGGTGHVEVGVVDEILRECDDQKDFEWRVAGRDAGVEEGE